MFIDAHCHLSFPEFDNDRKDVIQRLADNEISLLIDPGTNLFTSKRSIALSSHHSFIFSTVGIHPHDAGKTFDEATASGIEQLAESPRVVGIGETGLDYHYEGYDREKQISAFRAMLQIAKTMDIPVVIHSRDAWDDTLSILKDEKSSNLRGMMHCFSGNAELARECIRLGFKISIPGTITYRKSSLPDVVMETAIGDLLTETDAPWLAPVPFRGKRNEPAHVRIITEQIAYIKELPLDRAAAIISGTAHDLFSITRTGCPPAEKRNG